ncbi:MAG: hypothetical protein ACI9R3_001632 [Verrucomicrobiales bacterium]|jgi:hypothetical protein
MKSLLITLSLIALGMGVAQAATTFSVTFSGNQENPAVVSTATGSGTLSLNDDESRLSILLSFTGIDLDSTQTASTADDLAGLHIHLGAAGANGGVIFGIPANDTSGDTLISAEFGSVASVWDAAEGNGTTLTDQLVSLKAGNLYLNVHTTANPSGEIRGQIIPNTVPEPTTGLLSLLGVAVLGLRRRR